MWPKWVTCKERGAELAVDRDRVRQALRDLDGERALRNLLGRELGYEHEGGRISDDSWPEELDGDPTLFATAGREAGL